MRCRHKHGPLGAGEAEWYATDQNFRFTKARLDVDEIERSLRLPISASVPSDGLLPASVNEGIPIVESHPKSKPAKAFEDVTQIVMDTRQPSQDANKKRRFGR